MGTGLRCRYRSLRLALHVFVELCLQRIEVEQLFGERREEPGRVPTFSFNPCPYSVKRVLVVVEQICVATVMSRDRAPGEDQNARDRLRLLEPGRSREDFEPALPQFERS